MYNKLLERQLKRFTKNIAFHPSDWKLFFDAVSLSYDYYERDHMLGQRSLEISSEEQHQHTLKIQEREAKIRAIVEAASDGIIVVNDSNKIEVCNSIASQILPFDKEENRPFDLFKAKIRVHDNFGVPENEVMSLGNFLSNAKKFVTVQIPLLRRGI